jgi:hypothetical protein
LVIKTTVIVRSIVLVFWVLTVLGWIDKLLEYLSRSVVARFCVWQSTLSEWLDGKHHPMGKSLAKLRTFLDAETKRSTSIIQKSRALT